MEKNQDELRHEILVRAGALAAKELSDRQIENFIEQERKMKKENEQLKDKLAGIQDSHHKEMMQLSDEFRKYEQDKINGVEDLESEFKDQNTKQRL